MSDEPVVASRSVRPTLALVVGCDRVVLAMVRMAVVLVLL